MDSLPVDAGLVGDDGVAFDAGKGGEGDLEQVHGGGRVGVVHHGGADVGGELLPVGELVELPEEVERLGFGETLDELGEGLGGDADGLDLVAGGLELGFDLAEGAEGFGDLRLPGVAVEADEGGDGADLWL